MKRLLAGVMALAMLAGSFPAVPAFADTVRELMKTQAKERDGRATPSDASVASPSDAETATPSSALRARAVPGSGYYQLEAENTGENGYAEWVNVNANGEGNRAELQQNGEVKYALSKVEGFDSGNYLVSVNMNGNSQTIGISVNGERKGTVSKADAGWSAEDLKEYYYHGVLELKTEDSLTVSEAGGQYAHLDWTRLRPVADSVYWLEAEDASSASLEGGAQVHGDGDRVELNSGAGVSFELARVNGFKSGVYRLFAGANGARESLSVTVDGEDKGTVRTPGEGKWEKGTCIDCGFGEELELKADSVLRLADNSGSWGHVDYIRLERVDDLKSRFDYTDPETGIRVVAEEGVLADGTELKVGNVKTSDKNRFRDLFKENDQKAYFYSFHLEDSRGGRIDLGELEGEVTAYLPIPAGYAETSELYYAADGDDFPVSETGYEVNKRKIKFSLTAYGIYIIADENAWQLEGEEYYEKTTDGGKAADLQPNDKIDFKLPAKGDGFEAGLYNLLIRTCGYQSYTVLVNGSEKADLTKMDTSWGEYETYTVKGALRLAGKDTLSIATFAGQEDKYGWVDYIRLVPCKPFAETHGGTGITVEAEAGVVPAAAALEAEPVTEEALEEILRQFGYTQETAPPMSFFDIFLLLGGERVQPGGTLTISIPIPEGYDREAICLYHIGDNGVKTRVSFRLSNDGTHVIFEADHLSLYGLVNQPAGSEIYYWAMDYYDKTSGSGNQFADLQPEGEVVIPVADNQAFAEGNYILSLRGNGNRTKLMVKINDVPVGMLSKDSTGFDENEDMKAAELEKVLSLKNGDVISIYAPGTEGLGPYGWVDYLKLKGTDREAVVPAKAPRVTLQAEDYWPDALEAEGRAANINNPAKKLEIPILAEEGFEEKDYLFTMYTTGTMRSWEVSVNGSTVLSGEREGSGYEMKYMTKEIGSSLLHLKPGDILTIQFPEQETDNYGNWVDRIVLNSSRQVTDKAFEERTGGRILAEQAAGLMKNSGPQTSAEGGKLIYQGEAYYQPQKDNPAADLQPGEQLMVPVSDNRRFAEGEYRVSVRSCGNRESFAVKVNGERVGSISRKETGYGMDAMTEDAMGAAVSLKKGDILILEGETGGKYGWVDYISLTPVQRTGEQSAAKVRCTWEAEQFYQKQKDNPAADLQPGDEIKIPLNTNETFVEGTYDIAVLSNGNRTAMTIKKNGVLLGSITRNESHFAMTGMTMDRLMRPVRLEKGDVISICAPAETEAGKGPWGWVDKMTLIPSKAPNPQPKEEYRYPAQAYGTASLYLPAADLQPEESLVIPLSDNPEFTEGTYRILVISNGTRERFDLRLNGGAMGSIHRKKSDYGDNGMSADRLAGEWYLKPSDVITVTGQAGDYYGWVNSLVLEPADQEGKR